MNRSHWWILCLLLVTTMACQRVEEVPITDWVHCSDFPGAARCSGTAFTIGDTAYVCGGRTGWDKDLLRETWQYEATSDRWTRVADFPGKARVRPVGVCLNGRGYVGMGSDGSIYPLETLTDWWAYDPTTNTWERRADFPGSAPNDLAYAVIHDCVYVTMGFSGATRLRETWKYDPVSNAWTRLAECPTTYSAPAFFALGDALYVGTGFQSRNVRIFYRYDTRTDVWSQVAAAPQAKMLANGLSIDGKGYVLLGRYWHGLQNGGRLMSDVAEYDPAANAWVNRGDFPGEARQNAMVFTLKGRGYVVMGENDSRRLNDVWSFKP
jgi:N-acetylneuraminic acid mutarotase